MVKNSKKTEGETAKKDVKAEEDVSLKRDAPGAVSEKSEKKANASGSEEERRKSERRKKERRTEDRRQDESPVEDPRLGELREKVAEKEEDILKLRGEADSLKDLLQRRQADFENYKKRNARLMEDSKKFAIRDFASDIILINDDLLRAIEASSSVSGDEESLETSYRSFVDGVSMISKRIEETLRNYGIEEIEAEGQPFNPNFHEAVEIEMSDSIETDTVTHVHQKGFRIDEMVVRSSKVKVAKPMPRQDQAQSEEKKSEQPDK